MNEKPVAYSALTGQSILTTQIDLEARLHRTWKKHDLKRPDLAFSKKRKYDHHSFPDQKPESPCE